MMMMMMMMAAVTPLATPGDCSWHVVCGCQICRYCQTQSTLCTECASKSSHFHVLNNTECWRNLAQEVICPPHVKHVKCRASFTVLTLLKGGMATVYMWGGISTTFSCQFRDDAVYHTLLKLIQFLELFRTWRVTVLRNWLSIISWQTVLQSRGCGM